MESFTKLFSYFIFITLIYVIINIIIIINSIQTDEINKYTYLEYLYIFILVFGIYLLNIQGQNDTKNNINILFYTVIPWTIIFLSIVIILKTYNNWISPFSNTIGYGIVNLLGLSNKFKSLININYDSISDEEGDKSKLREAIINFKNNYEILLNSLNPYDDNNYETFFSDFAEAKILKISDDNKDAKEYIKKLLIIKEFIGKICWFILAGILTISVMNDSISNIS